MPRSVSRSLLRAAWVLFTSLIAGAAIGQDYKVVEGVSVYLGVVPAESIRSQSKEYPASVSGAIPLGPEQYFVTVALFDAKNGERITDAVVRARISGATEAGAEKTLGSMTIANSLTYGNYFPMAGAGPFKITVHIYRPNLTNVIQAQFEHSK